MAPARLQIPKGCPWVLINAARSARIFEELRREIGPDHPLFPKQAQLRVIAACQANDDVLAVTTDDENQLFCIHLTWAENQIEQSDQYPAFELVKRADLYRLFQRYTSVE